MTDVTGVLVGGGIAIVTTIANVTYNWLQNRSERQFAMRQQVYLEACEWAARGVEYLASFARLDIDDAQLAQILRSSGTSAYKVHIVAEQQTVAAFTAASEYLANESIALTTSRVRVRQHAMRLHGLETEAAQTSAYL